MLALFYEQMQYKWGMDGYWVKTYNYQHLKGNRENNSHWISFHLLEDFWRTQSSEFLKIHQCFLDADAASDHWILSYKN